MHSSSPIAFFQFDFYSTLSLYFRSSRPPVRIFSGFLPCLLVLSLRLVQLLLFVPYITFNRLSSCTVHFEEKGEIRNSSRKEEKACLEGNEGEGTFKLDHGTAHQKPLGPTHCPYSSTLYVQFTSHPPSTS